MEVQKYIDPERTYGFGIAMAPDTAMRGASGESDSDERALVIHSLFMPYLLLVFQSALRNTQNADVEKLPAHLQAIGQGFKGSRFRDRNALEPSNYNVGKLKS